jgi:hypothetical protein
MYKDKYIVEIESSCYLYLAGRGVSVTLKIERDDIKQDTIVFTKEDYDKISKSTYYDYGFVNSIYKKDDKYILNKISRTKTYNVDLSIYEQDRDLEINDLHLKNVEPIIKNFKCMRLFSGNEFYVSNLKSVIKYINLTTNEEKIIIKTCDGEMPPYNRLEENYLEEYSNFGKDGNEYFSFAEIDDAFQNADEQLKTTFEMFDNALLSPKLEICLLLFVATLEGLFLKKDEDIKNPLNPKRRLSKSTLLALRIHALMARDEPFMHEYKTINEIYRKRSDLIHFGRKSEITHMNVLALRRTASSSIIKYIKWRRENSNKTHEDFIQFLSVDFEKYLKEIDNN